MSEILNDFSPLTIAAAIELNNCQMFASFAHLPQAALYHEPEMMWVKTPIPHFTFNSVLRTHLPADIAEQRIKERLLDFQAQELPMSWFVGPTSRPVNLEEYLIAHELIHATDFTGMAVDLHRLEEEQPTPSGLVIEQVQDSAALKHWIQVFQKVFRWPDFAGDALFDLFNTLGFDAPWRHYLGRHNGTPVATASLLLDVGVAGIGFVSTLPQAQRQGVGTAITLAALRDARALGYRIGVLSATRQGENMYRRMGFAEYCHLGYYIWHGEL